MYSPHRKYQQVKHAIVFLNYTQAVHVTYPRVSACRTAPCRTVPCRTAPCRTAPHRLALRANVRHVALSRVIKRFASVTATGAHRLRQSHLIAAWRRPSQLRYTLRILKQPPEEQPPGPHSRVSYTMHALSLTRSL
uniref:Uncharacterized protein n=1 Tax=Heliothis virescens TaxID=7102 RepID=A0A2A4J9U3_HELVI